jgi:hypothetical protein
MVDCCLDHYQKHCAEGERFGEILERTGREGLTNWTKTEDRGPKIEEKDSEGEFPAKKLFVS